MRKPATTLLLLFLFSFSSRAQNGQIDSLKQVLQTAADDTNKVKKLVVVSSKYGQRGEFDSCLVYTQKTLHLSQTLNYKAGLASAYTLFGIIYKERANYPLALENAFQALAIRESMSDKRAIAGALNNIATIYKELKNLDKALEYNQRSLKIKEEIGDSLGIAASLNNIATIVRLAGKIDEALAYNQRALNIREKMKDIPGVALSLNNIGNIYREKKMFDKALEYHLRSYQMRMDLGDHKGIAMSLETLAQDHLHKNENKKALQYALKCLTESRSAGLLSDEMETENLLHEVYEKMNDHHSSLIHYKRYILLRDSVFNEENTKNEVRLEMNYEFEKKQAIARADQQRRDVIAEADKKRQKLILYGVSGLLLFVALFAAYAYRSYRQKRKANIAITMQKALIEEKQKEILDSIHYARRIQNALITSERYISSNLARLRK